VDVVPYRGFTVGVFKFDKKNCIDPRESVPSIPSPYAVADPIDTVILIFTILLEKDSEYYGSGILIFTILLEKMILN